LNPPTADRAIEQLPFAQAFELGNLDHTEAIFITHIGVEPLHRDATAMFDAECALIRDIVNALIDGCDLTLAFRFLLRWRSCGFGL